MNALAGFFASGTTRRFVAFGIGAVALVLNKKFGLDIDQQAQMELTALVMAFIAQSAAREAHATHVQGVVLSDPRPVTDVKEAVEELRKGPTP